MRQPRAADVVLCGGLAAGILDILNAIVFWRLYSGTSASVILQSVAAGIQGKAAFAGGAGSAALGLFLHLSSCARWRRSTGSPAGAGRG